MAFRNMWNTSLPECNCHGLHKHVKHFFTWMFLPWLTECVNHFFTWMLLPWLTETCEPHFYLNIPAMAYGNMWNIFTECDCHGLQKHVEHFFTWMLLSDLQKHVKHFFTWMLLPWLTQTCKTLVYMNVTVMAYRNMWNTSSPECYCHGLQKHVKHFFT